MTHKHHKYEFKFCPVCGGRLSSQQLRVHEPSRLVCGDCGFVFYLDPKLAACSIVEMDGRIVLAKRGIMPQRDKWALPGGHVDRGEVVEIAACRETAEECGIQTRIKNLLGVYSGPGRTVVIVVYVAEFVSGDLIPGDETLDVRLCKIDEIPWEELAFPSTVAALRDYCDSKGKDVTGHDHRSTED